MITYKVRGQEYSISYKGEKEIGRATVGFETFETERDMAASFLTGLKDEAEAKVELTEGQFEQLEDGMKEILYDVKRGLGIWWNEECFGEYYYSGRPEPHDGYGKEGTQYTYEVVDNKDVLKEKRKALNTKKKKALKKITELTDKVAEIDFELTQL